MNLEEKLWPQWESDDNVEKSKKDTSKLVPVQRQVTRGGTTFQQTVWVSPRHAKTSTKETINVPEWSFSSSSDFQAEFQNINAMKDKTARQHLKGELLNHVEKEMGVSYDKVPDSDPRANVKNMLRGFSAAKKALDEGTVKQKAKDEPKKQSADKKPAKKQSADKKPADKKQSSTKAVTPENLSKVVSVSGLKDPKAKQAQKVTNDFIVYGKGRIKASEAEAIAVFGAMSAAMREDLNMTLTQAFNKVTGKGKLIVPGTPGARAGSNSFAESVKKEVNDRGDSGFYDLGLMDEAMDAVNNLRTKQQRGRGVTKQGRDTVFNMYSELRHVQGRLMQR